MNSATKEDSRSLRAEKGRGVTWLRWRSTRPSRASRHSPDRDATTHARDLPRPGPPPPRRAAPVETTTTANHLVPSRRPSPGHDGRAPVLRRRAAVVAHERLLRQARQAHERLAARGGPRAHTGAPGVTDPGHIHDSPILSTPGKSTRRRLPRTGGFDARRG